jgi:hypothetical protein
VAKDNIISSVCIANILKVAKEKAAQLMGIANEF